MFFQNVKPSHQTSHFFHNWNLDDWSVMYLFQFVLKICVSISKDFFFIRMDPLLAYCTIDIRYWKHPEKWKKVEDVSLD